MNTAMVYASKHGATKKVVSYIKSKNDNYKVFDIKTQSLDIQNFDRLIVMSPIYAGNIDKRIKVLLQTIKEKFPHLKLHIVLVGMNKAAKDDMISIYQDYTDNVLFVGGAYDFEDMNFLERFIVKKIAKVNESIEDIDYTLVESL